MRLKMKPLPALLATLLIGCGGGNSSGPQGETASTQVTATALTACIDANQNWQCDDGDRTLAATASGSSGLVPAAGQYTLLETRDATNRRTRLLVSELGSGTANGTSTLRTFLRAAGKTATEIAAVETTVNNTALEAGFASALTSHPVALAALATYSQAVAAQGTASPVLTAYAPSTGSVSSDVTWASSESSTTVRQLTAQSSTVLNNSESNRLYLFDAAATDISSREIDLIPPPSVVLASAAPWLRWTVARIDQLLSVFVDTASAATAFTGTPSDGSVVTLSPGKGIVGIQLVNNATEAIVSLNMLAGGFTGSSCLGTSDGNEGLFRVSLSDTASFRTLKDAPACIHSGFSLLASNPAGTRIAAWDATGGKLWVLDGSTLQARATLDLQLPSDAPPQALAVTPGGRYLAVLSYGRATLVDLENGRVITQLAGAWGNVAQGAFASGARRLLVASGQTVHTLALDNALQLISSSSATVAGSGETLRALSVATDGDSYVTTSDAKAYWRTTVDSGALGTATLPSGLQVQQATLADKRLVVLSRGSQDGEFKLLRLPLGLPTSPTFATGG
jgi:hypothetical protein